MSRRQHSYDEECERLARHFLADEFAADEMGPLSKAASDLAQEIQECVEGWLSVTDLVLYTRTPHSDGE